MVYHKHVYLNELAARTRLLKHTPMSVFFYSLSVAGFLFFLRV